MFVIKMKPVVISLFVIIVTVYLIENGFALPRDSSALKTEDVQNYYEPLNKLDRSSTEESIDTVPKIPNRVSCEYEEATEDPVCQEHCIPKGYSYGICTSKTCSCV
ncbi:defensin-like protein isoform 1-T1 [Aphomia sociella]